MKKFVTSLLVGAAALGFVSASYAADLVVEEPIVDYPVIPTSIWDGGYVGVFGGIGWATLEFDPVIDDGLCWPDGCDIDLDGWLFGVNAGWNFTLNGGGSAVLGIAGDIAWADISGDDAFDDFEEEFGDWESDATFEGSVRGVLGWDGGAWMPYLTAGVAFLNVEHSSEIDDPLFDDFDDDNTHIGGTFGVGVAFAVAENLSLDLQWRGTWYDTDDDFDVDWLEDEPDLSLTTSRVTAGINWSF